jgi:hypothetical protein
VHDRGDHKGRGPAGQEASPKAAKPKCALR